MAYRIAQFSMTLGGIQGYSSIASLFKCDFGTCTSVPPELTGFQLTMRGDSWATCSQHARCLLQGRLQYEFVNTPATGSTLQCRFCNKQEYSHTVPDCGHHVRLGRLYPDGRVSLPSHLSTLRTMCTEFCRILTGDDTTAVG